MSNASQVQVESGDHGLAVFLSYHSSRSATAEHLAGYFERHGMPTWYAARDITPGSTWSDEIVAAVQSSEALVLLFCANADRSPQVKREIHLADSAGVPIYWLRLESVSPDRLQYFLNSTQWVDWLDERDTVLDQLIEALQAGEGTDLSIESRSSPPPHGEGIAGDWPRELLSLDKERDAAEVAARVMMTQAQRNADSSVILPTGRTATHIFRAMLRVAKDFGNRPFGDAHLITDTETFGVWPGHHTSRTRHVRESLIEPLIESGFEVDPAQLHLLSGLITEKDPIREAARTIRLWPPSVHAVSVAPSGEVLAYEVGLYTDPDEIASDGPRVIELSEYGRGYIDADQPSRSVLSIGLDACLSAQILLVPVLDPRKGNILRQMITGPETAGVTATLLRRHHNAIVLTTQRVVADTDLGPHARPVSVPDAVDLILQET